MIRKWPRQLIVHIVLMLIVMNADAIKSQISILLLEPDIISAPGAHAIKAVAGAAHTVALLEDGTVQAWGANESGQLGHGTQFAAKSAANVKRLTGVKDIASGFFYSLAVMGDGTVHGWGDNSYESIRATHDPLEKLLAPEPIPGLNNVKQIASGNDANFALLEDGRVFAWGNTFLNNPDSNAAPAAPFELPELRDALEIDGGYSGVFMAVMPDHTVLTWGPPQTGFTRVKELSGIRAISSGGAYRLALLEDGSVWAWGDNNAGQLGNGTTIESNTPVKVRNLEHVIAIAAGNEHALALLSDKTIMAWGYNASGQLGNGKTNTSSIPLTVKNLSGVRSIAAGQSHSLAILEDGTLKAWGWNGFGQLGTADTIDSSLPKTIQLR
jgi:alpha-tubulin suppressor-like RCC1 family protein